MGDRSPVRSQTPVTMERPYWIGWWNAIVLAAVITSGVTFVSAQRFPFGRLGVFDFVVRPSALFLMVLPLVIGVASLVFRFRPNRWTFDGHGWTDECPMGVSSECISWESIVEVEMTLDSSILLSGQWPLPSTRLSVSYESASERSARIVATSEVHPRALATLVDQLDAHVPPERIDRQVLCYGSDQTTGRPALDAYIWRVVSVGLVLGVGGVAATWWWLSTM